MYASSIEQTALEAFAAKKKLAQQRQELKTFLNYTFGPNAYAELLQMEGQIRKDRQKAIYERQQLKDQIIGILGIVNSDIPELVPKSKLNDISFSFEVLGIIYHIEIFYSVAFSNWITIQLDFSILF